MANVYFNFVELIVNFAGRQQSQAEIGWYELYVFNIEIFGPVRAPLGQQYSYLILTIIDVNKSCAEVAGQSRGTNVDGSRLKRGYDRKLTNVGHQANEKNFSPRYQPAHSLKTVGRCQTKSNPTPATENATERLLTSSRPSSESGRTPTGPPKTS